ncbi:hypothetical protein GGI35DRAFT_474438 [Trichoderma velutinum]
MAIWYPYLGQSEASRYISAVQYEQAAVLPRPKAACGTAVEKFQTKQTGRGLLVATNLALASLFSSTETLDRRANMLGNRACGITGLAWLHATHNTISVLLNGGSSRGHQLKSLATLFVSVAPPPRSHCPSCSLPLARHFVNVENKRGCRGSMAVSSLSEILASSPEALAHSIARCPTCLRK